MKYRFDRFAPYVERGGCCWDAVSLCESVLQGRLLAGQSSGALSAPPEEGQNDLRLAFGGRNGNNNPMNNPFRADEIDKRNAKALSSHVREYLVDHLRLLRSSDYDGSESMKKIDSSLQHPEKCNWGRLNGPITRRGSAGVQHAKKWSLRMLRAFRKHSSARCTHHVCFSRETGSGRLMYTPWTSPQSSTTTSRCASGLSNVENATAACWSCT